VHFGTFKIGAISHIKQRVSKSCKPFVYQLSNELEITSQWSLASQKQNSLFFVAVSH